MSIRLREAARAQHGMEFTAKEEEDPDIAKGVVYLVGAFLGKGHNRTSF